jgi:hypothetical protein
MSGERPDDVVFHLRFQAEILDQVARIAATLDGREKARKQAAELRIQAGRLDRTAFSGWSGIPCPVDDKVSIRPR